jgi:hypothetical protein
MIDIAKARIGDRVRYIGYLGAKAENGRIKEIPEGQYTSVRVVYHCAGEWRNFMNYTSVLTDIVYLYDGWKLE